MGDADPSNGVLTIREGANGTSRDAASEAQESEEQQIARLRAEVASSRRRLDSSLHQLEHRVSEGVDWRHYVSTHPWLCLAAATALGYAVGRAFRSSDAQRWVIRLPDGLRRAIRVA